MGQLNKIVAVEKGVKSRAHAALTDAHHQLQKGPLLSGLARTYRPKDDEGEQLPPESTRVQLRSDDIIKEVVTALTRLMDVTLTKDVANGIAKANIIVGGDVLAYDVPVTYLLFLEKQLIDLHTFVSKLPALDPSEAWTYDDVAEAWATAPASTTRSKKVPRNHVRAEATDRHPAQVEMYSEDVLAGYWTTVKYSGALPRARISEIKARVVTLAEAVKVAREQANMELVTDQVIGAKIFSYVFG